MRKVLILGFVLVCVTAVSFLAVTPVERKVLDPEPTLSLAASTRPTQVEVTNFPAVQPVSGSVAVANLPTDGSGRLLVSVQGGFGALVLHSTTASYQGNLGGRTGATQKCRTEFPESHFATFNEIMKAIEDGRGIVYLSSESSHSWLDSPSDLANHTCGEWLEVDTQPSSGIEGGFMGPKGTDFVGSGHTTTCYSSLPLLCAE